LLQGTPLGAYTLPLISKCRPLEAKRRRSYQDLWRPY